MHALSCPFMLPSNSPFVVVVVVSQGDMTADHHPLGERRVACVVFRVGRAD